MWLKVEPIVNTTLLLVPEPNTFPVFPVPCVNDEPLLNVIPLASAATKVFAEVVKFNVPLILPVAPVAKVNAKALAPVAFKALPEATDKSAPVTPLLIVKAPAAAGCKFTVVFADTNIPPTVSTGILVTVVVAPLLNCKISAVFGVVLVGDQLVSVVQEAVPVWFQV